MALLRICSAKNLPASPSSRPCRSDRVAPHSRFRAFATSAGFFVGREERPPHRASVAWLLCFFAATLSMAKKQRSRTRSMQPLARKSLAEESRCKDLDSSSSGRSPKLWLACLAAIPGSFQYGFGLSAINIPQVEICGALGLRHTGLTWSLLVAILSPAGLLGARIGPPVISRIGLLGALNSTAGFFILSGVLFLISHVASVVQPAVAYSSFATARIFQGLGAGAATVFVPLYLGRIAPLQLRGAIGNLHQVAIVTGLFVAQCLGACLPWHAALATTAVFGAAQLLLSPLLYEPKSAEDIVRDGSATPTSGFRALFSDRSVRRPLIMAVVLMALQQYCGINGVWYYSTSLFASAGLHNPVLGTLVASVVFLAATLAAVPLIEKVGRRPLLLWGQLSAGLSLGLLTAALFIKSTGYAAASLDAVTVMMVICFVSAFAVSLGPIPWQISNEIFPLRHRATAQCLVASICEIFSASVALGFPLLQRCCGPFVFAPSLFVLLAGCVYVNRGLPETKNREVEAIVADFQDGRARKGTS